MTPRASRASRSSPGSARRPARDSEPAGADGRARRLRWVDVQHARPRGDLTEETRQRLVRTLADGGFLAPEEEADELIAAAAGDPAALDRLLERRLHGEPLAWITGSVTFCGLRIAVEPGVYVPRPFTQALARRAASLLPSDGIAVDLCTGSGAVAAVLGSAEPAATVLATDLDEAAVACARRNGVDARLGDLFAPLPAELRGRVDVVTAVPPYVPTEELRLLPRDVLAFEPRAALDGGPDGTTLLERVVRLAPAWLVPGGHLILELGGDESDPVSGWLAEEGFENVRVHRDEEGDDRAIEASCARMRQA